MTDMSKTKKRAGFCWSICAWWRGWGRIRDATECAAWTCGLLAAEGSQDQADLRRKTVTSPSAACKDVERGPGPEGEL